EVTVAPAPAAVEPAVVIAPQEGWGGGAVGNAGPVPRAVVVAPPRDPGGRSPAPWPVERAVVAGAPAGVAAARVAPAGEANGGPAAKSAFNPYRSQEAGF
ncbi:MAG: hypothetical protein ACXWC6_17580, partial [Ramlibacter sp.]